MLDKVKCRAFNSSCVVDTSGRVANLALNLARGLEICTRQPERKGSLAIVGSGPSVLEHLDELRNWSGEIWAINGAYDWLQDQGIVPHGFIAIDPLPGLAEYVKRAHKDTTFYIASCCDPSVLDALEGFKVKLWHALAEDTKYPEGSFVIGGGTTTVTRAPYLGLGQGWRDIVLYGVDSSYGEDGTEYCYQWGRYELDIDQPKQKITCGGDVFLSELGLLKQVSQLGVMQSNFRGMLRFKCGGLMEAFLSAPMCDESHFELEDETDADKS